MFTAVVVLPTPPFWFEIVMNPRLFGLRQAFGCDGLPTTRQIGNLTGQGSGPIEYRSAATAVLVFTRMFHVKPLRCDGRLATRKSIRMALQPGQAEESGD